MKSKQKTHQFETLLTTQEHLGFASVKKVLFIINSISYTRILNFFRPSPNKTDRVNATLKSLIFLVLQTSLTPVQANDTFISDISLQSSSIESGEAIIIPSLERNLTLRWPADEKKQLTKKNKKNKKRNIKIDFNQHEDKKTDLLSTYTDQSFNEDQENQQANQNYFRSMRSDSLGAIRINKKSPQVKQKADQSPLKNEGLTLAANKDMETEVPNSLKRAPVIKASSMNRTNEPIELKPQSQMSSNDLHLRVSQEKNKHTSFFQTEVHFMGGSSFDSSDSQPVWSHFSLSLNYKAFSHFKMGPYLQFSNRPYSFYYKEDLAPKWTNQMSEMDKSYFKVGGKMSFTEVERIFDFNRNTKLNLDLLIEAPSNEMAAEAGHNFNTLTLLTMHRPWLTDFKTTFRMGWLYSDFTFASLTTQNNEELVVSFHEFLIGTEALYEWNKNWGAGLGVYSITPFFYEYDTETQVHYTGNLDFRLQPEMKFQLRFTKGGRILGESSELVFFNRNPQKEDLLIVRGEYSFN